jgi:GntR family transcriptional regulator/MocR family aminotransferase
VRYDLRPGIPDLRATPRSRWAAALRTAVAELPDHALAAAHPHGYAPARVAVAAYLSRSRHAAAEAARVTITHGATDGMGILSRELHRRGHRSILVEDPSWPRLRVIAEENGLRPIPVPVDDHGVDTARLLRLAADTGARAALVTPAHQFPLGAALAPVRREELVRWARETDGVVIEDDYDAEFRYDRRPIPALQRLAPDRVALIGSLSKSVSPALGVGWMLLPPDLAPAPPVAPPSLIDQAALAEFITRGDLERHLRSSRTRFRRRRRRLLEALQRELPELSVSGIAAGMHLVLSLPDGSSATEITAAATAAGLALTPLARYACADPQPESLVLGYGDLDDTLVEEAVARLAALLRSGR